MLCGRVPFSGDSLYEECGQSRQSDDPRIVTQAKIIERIRNASASLDFKEERWKDVSEAAKQLLRGLLNVDPKKRMKLKDLARCQWVRTCAGSVNGAGGKVMTNLATANVLNGKRKEQELGVLVEEAGKCKENSLRTQFNLAFDAYHAAEKKGKLF